MNKDKKQDVAIKAGAAPTEKLEILNDKSNSGKVMKIGLSLDRTIELVSALYNRTKHRARLQYYTDKLTSFEIAQKEEVLDDERYSYRGCVLTIKDDDGKDFTMKNPILIYEVVKFLQKRFEEKVSEIESEIVLP
jgi:hypothetical protein